MEFHCILKFKEVHLNANYVKFYIKDYIIVVFNFYGKVSNANLFFFIILLLPGEFKSLIVSKKELSDIY